MRPCLSRVGHGGGSNGAAGGAAYLRVRGAGGASAGDAGLHRGGGGDGAHRQRGRRVADGCEHRVPVPCAQGGRQGAAGQHGGGAGAGAPLAAAGSAGAGSRRCSAIHVPCSALLQPTAAVRTRACRPAPCCTPAPPRRPGPSGGARRRPPPGWISGSPAATPRRRRRACALRRWRTGCPSAACNWPALRRRPSRWRAPPAPPRRAAPRRCRALPALLLPPPAQGALARRGAAWQVDDALKGRTFLVSHLVTLADLVVYGTLYPALVRSLPPPFRPRPSPPLHRPPAAAWASPAPSPPLPRAAAAASATAAATARPYPRPAPRRSCRLLLPPSG